VELEGLDESERLVDGSADLHQTDGRTVNMDEQTAAQQHG
jgi:hypothetical protein